MESPMAWKMVEIREEEQEEEEEEEGDEPITKKLLFDCAETPDINGGFAGGGGGRKVPANPKNRSVVVYLRIRPKSQREIMTMDASCLHLVNKRELQAVAPTTSQTYKNKTGARCPGESTQQFSFTHIFDETATQRDVFEEALMPTVRDFFNGQNCLVFTYGVTNSGKTYTVTGTPAEPGILPRSLDLIFNTVTPQQMSSLDLLPKNFSEAIYLSEEEAESQRIKREAIWNKARGISEVEELGDTTTDISSNISTISKASSNYSKVSVTGASLCEMRVQDGSTIDFEEGEGGGGSDMSYSLWVSFCEIYNEFIYDLLAEEPEKSRRSRPALRLAEDRNHNHFIRGLVEVKVESVEEAQLLLRMGQRHRHVASTCLNYQSSRSHTIFTVKIIKVRAGSARPHSAFVNRISVVDLAGAERSKETGARGMRVREAGNINTSLLTLGKCIGAMKHNQNKRKGEDHIVPFRESKLTQLFQNYFIGKGKGVRQGKITMLVNVSNIASVFDETIHVLKFSALTSKVIPTVKEVAAMLPPASRTRPTPSARVLRSATARVGILTSAAATTGTSQRTMKREPLTAAPLTTASHHENKNEETKKTVSLDVCEQCEDMKEAVRRLRGKMAAIEVEKMETEYQIRREVCREFQEQITDIEDAHREELEEQAEEMQVMYDRRMELLQKSMKKEFNRKRRRVATREEDDEEERESRGIEAQLRDTIARLEEELETKREKNVVLSAELKDAAETHETKMTLLNNQVNGVSLRAVEAEKTVQELKETLSQAIRREEERATALEMELKNTQSEQARAEKEAAAALEKEGELDKMRGELQMEVERMTKLVEEKEKEAEERSREIQLKMENMTLSVQETQKEMKELQEDRLSLISEYEANEGQLREEMAGLKTQLVQKTQEMSECVRREKEAEEKVIEAEARRDDAVAEEEILQARISELTKEIELEANGQQQSSGLEKQLMQLNTTHTRSQEELEETRKLHCATQEELEETRKLHCATQEELEETRKLHCAIQKELEETRKLHCATQEELEEARKLHCATQEELEETRKLHCATQQELAELTATHNTTLLELSGLKTAQQRQLEEADSAASQKIVELNTTISKTQQELEELRVTYSGAQQELTNTKRAHHTSELEVTELRMTHQAELEEMRAANLTIQEKLTLANTTHHQKLEEMKTSHSALKHELVELKATHQEELLQQMKSHRQTAEEEMEKVVAGHSEEMKEQESVLIKELETNYQQELSAVKTAVQQVMTQLHQKEKIEMSEAHDQLVKEMTSSHSSDTAEMKRIHKLELADLITTQCEMEEEVVRLKKVGNEARERLADLVSHNHQIGSDLQRANEKIAAMETQLLEKEKEQEAGRESRSEETLSNDKKEETSEEELTSSTDSQTESERVLSPPGIPRSDSKPFVHILDHSSQLVEEEENISPDDPVRIIIDATPPVARKGRGRKHKTERDVQIVNIDEPQNKRGKYQLRNRNKHKRFEDVENKGPKYFLNKVKHNQEKKVLASTQPLPCLPRSPSSSPLIPQPLARETRSTRSKIRKSQISGPLQLVGSPAYPVSRPCVGMGPLAPPLYHDRP